MTVSTDWQARHHPLTVGVTDSKAIRRPSRPTSGRRKGPQRLTKVMWGQADDHQMNDCCARVHSDAEHTTRALALAFPKGSWVLHLADEPVKSGVPRIDQNLIL
jgi:hypothetical protein